MTEKRIPERKVEGKPLGRHVHHDPASLEFPAKRAWKIRTVTHQAVGLPLDQGQIGSCTANALCGALNSAPNFTVDRGVKNEKDAVKLYELETQLEGEPYPPNDPGGSGLMVCRAARRLGWIKGYRHAFGLDHALKALVRRPVIFGVNWYDGFDEPDENGLVRIAGEVRGGHEVVAVSIDTAGRLVGFWNSWGTQYGLGGRFFMGFDTVDRLLGEQGDCTVPDV